MEEERNKKESLQDPVVIEHANPSETNTGPDAHTIESDSNMQTRDEIEEIHDAMDDEGPSSTQGMVQTGFGTHSVIPARSGDDQLHEGTKDPVVREFEEAAAMAATMTKEAAAVASENLMKLSQGAKAFLMNSSSWWGGGGEGQGQQPHSIEELHKRLGLAENDVVLESFKCKLLQQYLPSNNSFTGSKTIGFSCQLHIASKVIAIELDSSATPIVIHATEIQKVFEKDRETIVLELSGGRSVYIGHFSFPHLEVESAVALLKKCVDGI